MNIGKTIKLNRIRQDLSQRELAERAELSEVYIGYIEQGRRQPPVTTLSALAKAMNTTVSDIMREAEKL